MPPHRYAVLRAEQQLPNVVRIGVTNDIRQRMPEGQAPIACGARSTQCAWESIRRSVGALNRAEM